MPTSKAPTRYTIAGSSVKQTALKRVGPQSHVDGGNVHAYLWPRVGLGRGGKTQRRAAGRWRTRRQRQSRKTNDYSGCSLYLKACGNDQIWLWVKYEWLFQQHDSMGHVYSGFLHHNSESTPQEGQSVVYCQSLDSLLEEWENPCDENLEESKCINKYTPRMWADPVVDCWFRRVEVKNWTTHCGQERKVQEEFHGDSIATVLNSGQPGEAATVQTKHLNLPWWKQRQRGESKAVW